MSWSFSILGSNIYLDEGVLSLSINPYVGDKLFNKLPTRADIKWIDETWIIGEKNHSTLEIIQDFYLLDVVSFYINFM